MIDCTALEKKINCTKLNCLNRYCTTQNCSKRPYLLVLLEVENIEYFVVSPELVTVLCGAIQPIIALYGALLCGVVWCGALLCGVVWCGALLCGAIQPI